MSNVSISTNLSWSSAGYYDNPEPATPDISATVEKFIAAAETVQATFAQRQEELEQRLATAEHVIHEKLQAMHTMVNDFQTMLAEIDVREWCNTVDAIYRSGHENIEQMEAAYTEIQKSIKESGVRLEQTSSQVVKNLNRTLGVVHPAEFHNLIDHAQEDIQKVSKLASEQMTSVMRWFNWKNFAAVIFLSLLISVIYGLYVDSEWPWEEHKIAARQRVIGQAVLNSWQQLSPTDQHLIAAGAS